MRSIVATDTDDLAWLHRGEDLSGSIGEESFLPAEFIEWGTVEDPNPLAS
jgi:hypothetical protein